MRHSPFVAILAALLGGSWAALAIAPVSRHDSALENALLAMPATAALNAWLQRDFAQEWSDSLRVMDRRPYGEEEPRRLLASGEEPRA